MAERPAPRAASRFTRRDLLIGGTLAAASAVAFARQPGVANPAVTAERFEAWVPQRFGDWRVVAESGVVLPPPDALRDRLYDNLVTRVYVAPDQPAVMLLLAYNNAQDGIVQVHRPEFCYPVGGFELSPTRDFEIGAASQSIPASFFTASARNRVEQVAYFTRLGETFPRRWSEQRIAVMRANLDGEIPDGMMMRVSALSIGASEAMTLLSGFSRAFIEQSHPALQRLLLGSISKG